MKKLLLVSLLALALPVGRAMAEDCKDGCQGNSSPSQPSPNPDPLSYAARMDYADGTTSISNPNWYGYPMSGKYLGANALAVCQHLSMETVLHAEAGMYPGNVTTIYFHAPGNGKVEGPFFEYGQDGATSYVANVLCRK